MGSNISKAGTGGSAGSFLRLGLGADRAAMGDCGVALVGSGAGWYYNPATLPFSRNVIAAVGYRSMSLDRSISYAGFSFPLKPNGAAAFAVIRAATGDIDGRDSNGEPIGDLSYSDNIIHSSFALNPHPTVALGVSIKWMIAAAPDVIEDDKNLYAYGMGVDLGMLVKPSPRLRLGLQLRDLNAKYTWDSSEVWGDQQASKVDNLPNLVRVGAGYDLMPDLTLAADVVVNPKDVGDDSDAIRVHGGGEYRYEFQPGRDFALRAGWNGAAPSLGFGVALDVKGSIARMDYGFLIEQVSPGGSHLISWTFVF